MGSLSKTKVFSPHNCTNVVRLDHFDGSTVQARNSGSQIMVDKFQMARQPPYCVGKKSVVKFEKRIGLWSAGAGPNAQ